MRQRAFQRLVMILLAGIQSRTEQERIMRWGGRHALQKIFTPYAKWGTKEPVTLTFIYNDEKIGTDSTKAVPDLEFTFPDASRKGYSFAWLIVNVQMGYNICYL